MDKLMRQIDVLHGQVQRVEKENDFLREQLRLARRPALWPQIGMSAAGKKPAADAV
ncbi:MAG: hypothetical protein ACOY4H_05745 [Thermodesulfobacteriota bacterium]